MTKITSTGRGDGSGAGRGMGWAGLLLRVVGVRADRAAVSWRRLRNYARRIRIAAWTLGRRVPTDVFLPKYEMGVDLGSGPDGSFVTVVLPGSGPMRRVPCGPIDPAKVEQFVKAMGPVPCLPDLAKIERAKMAAHLPNLSAEHSIAWFLVLDERDGDSVVNLVCMSFLPEDRSAVDDFVTRCHDLGMWLTAMHPRAAAILSKQLGVQQTVLNATPMGGEDVAMALRAGGGA